MFSWKPNDKQRLQRTRSKYASDDPLRYQHVLRKDRLTEDPPVEADLIDLQWYKDNPDGAGDDV